MRPFTTNMLFTYLTCTALLTGTAMPAYPIENGKPAIGDDQLASAYVNVGALGFDIDGPMGPTQPFGVCSGFVISDWAFVTAAHCIITFERFAQSWEVSLESGSMDSPVVQPGIFINGNVFDFPMQVETKTTTQVHFHPEFDRQACNLDTCEFDVAVLEFPRGTFDVPPVKLARPGFLKRLKRLGILKRLAIGVVGYGAEGDAMNEMGDILGLWIPGYRNRGFSALGRMSRTRLFLEPTPVHDSRLLSGDSGSPQFVLGIAVSLSSISGLGEQRLDTRAIRRFLAPYIWR